MIATILTHPLFLTCVICFLSGSFGYILFRLWILPMYQYLRLRRKTCCDLSEIRNLKPGQGAGPETKKKLRQHAVMLSSIYNRDLPYWYRLLLKRRFENPLEASKVMMKLSNTKEPHHIEQQIEQITNHLKLKKTP